MVELPYPARVLWPNGRTLNKGYRAAEVKKHRTWACGATLADATRPATVGRLVFTIYPKPRGPLPDEDNAVAALKAYIDGVCDAYRIDDRHLPLPRLLFAERCIHGKVTLIVEGKVLDD